MAKKKKSKSRLRNFTPSAFNGSITNMKYIDLQRACIVRGIDFQELVEGDFPRLQVWLNKNWGNKKNPLLLNAFDEWRRTLMSVMNHPNDEPFIRLGFINQTDPTTGAVISTKRPRKITKDKKKRERTEEGLLTGTKKSLTYECCKAGKSYEATLAEVLSKYPDAAPKSVRIWFKRAEKSKG